jgi:dienelactone hydrolase
MAEILLFHHAQGLTPGVVAFADELRAAGHTVHTPDLYAGRTFDTLEAGVNHAQELGFPNIIAAGVQSAEDLPTELIYAGFSLGASSAQKLAQNRSGARGLLLFHAGFEPTEFGKAWPPEVSVQVHAMADDPEFNNGYDMPAAQALVAAALEGELFLYPGDQHLFADSSLSSYDAEATELMRKRVLDFLRDR